MAGNLEKMVKMACKPKSAAPKAKYLDSIIATTYAEDGSLHEVCRALAVRLRDPSTVVMHKALLVLHTMIRTGNTDKVLSFLSGPGADVLRLRQIANGRSDGHILSENITTYAAYLDMRIRSYKDLKHDPIRVQSDNNRETRISGGESSSGRGTNGATPSRSKTIAGRKLRSMTVEKGLLRETKGVQKQIDSLLLCRFYLDNLEDELILNSLRLLVKDLLILFQAENEGVINVLEHYFEMSYVDAEQALAIYKSFCVQTEGVVEYLSIARKLSNLLNIPVPNLRHAPVKLAGSLEEYLHDPNFEQNRIEYKTNKALADGKIPNKSKPESASTSAASPPPSKPAPSAESSKPATTAPKSQPAIDFFNSIEETQPSIFGNDSNPSQGASAGPYNPFRQSTLVTQMTGQPFFVAQPTGFPPNQASPFMQPQYTGMPFASASPFAQPTQPSPFGQMGGPMSPSPFLAPQSQPTGHLVPQATGSNPFRQSMMMMPQPTGILMGSSNSPFGGTPQSPVQPQPRSATAVTFSFPPPVNGGSNFQANPPQQSQSPFAAARINRPASTPVTSGSEPAMKPLVPHITGSRNPFGQPKAPSPPPIPKQPTLADLSYGSSGFMQSNMTGSPFAAQNSNAGNANNQSSFTNGLSPNGNNNSSNPGANMSSVASSFTFNKDSNNPDIASITAATPLPSLTYQPTSTSTMSDAFSNFSLGAPSSLGTQATGVSTPSLSPLQAQPTGFAGLKAFKPTSSFGASLVESVPPVSPNPATAGLSGGQNFGGQPSSPASGTSGSNPFGAINSQPTGFSAFNSSLNGNTSTVGTGLRPQMTGGVNPFRASMMSPTSTGSPFGAAQGQGQGGLTPNFTGLANGSSFGSSLFSGANSGFGTSPFKPTLTTIPSYGGSLPPGSNTQQQQQQQASASLI